MNWCQNQIGKVREERNSRYSLWIALRKCKGVGGETCLYKKGNHMARAQDLTGGGGWNKLLILTSLIAEGSYWRLQSRRVA